MNLLVKIEVKKGFSDLINNDFLNWETGKGAILNGGTGTGKTTWVLKVLQPYCVQSKKRILYIANRTELREEIDLVIKEEMIKNITVTTYQAIQSAILEGNMIEKYDYIVADECHYFLTDATFNVYTDLSFNFLLNNSDSVIIFMSATAERLFNKLIYEKKVSKEHQYVIPKDYSYVKELVFFEKDNLIGIIDDILENTNEKIIYFCNSIERAKSMYKKYKEIAHIKASKWTKDGELKELMLDDINCIKPRLIEGEQNITFEKRLLITTKALDNGINIIDREIKHIISDILDVDSMQQCLGRKRPMDAKDTCNFYLRNYLKNELVLFRNNINKELIPAQLFKNNRKEYENTYGKDRKFNTPTIWYNWELREWILNEIRYVKLLIDTNTINNMIEEDYFYFVKDLFKGVNKVCTMESMTNDHKSDDLENYLESIIGKVMLRLGDRKELIEKVNVRDGNNNRLLKNIETLNGKLKETGSQFIIHQFETSRMVDGKKKKYKQAWKVLKLLDLEIPYIFTPQKCI